jgi:mannosyltransferase OCH1-like enzyme
MSTRKNKNSIPKIIHQIWIGENVMPNEWIDTVKDFAKKYGYTYKLWRNDNIKTLDWTAFAGIKNTYDKMEKKSLAGCSDIIRLLALYEYGGIYIDADCVLLHPEKFVQFLQENKEKTFFAWEKLSQEHFKKFSKPTLENSDMYKRKKIIANSIIGNITWIIQPSS